MTFTVEELARIKNALIILRDIDAANMVKDGDEYDQEAERTAELIAKIEANT